MKRLVLAIVFCGLFTTTYGQSSPSGKLSKNERKPNFIQILTDDQGWGDLGSFGHEYIKTPNINQLAREGIKLVQCYSSAAVCSPSRSSILTGRTPFRNGVFRWVPADHFCHLQKDEVTLPQLLRKNGYQTTHFGKWHLSNYTEKKQGESKWPQPYSDFGFGTDPNQPSMEDYGYDYWFATGNVARPSHENPDNFFLNGKPMGPMKGYAAQLVAKEVVKWIRKYKNSNQPFFMTLWFHEPHGPIMSDPKFIEKYDDEIDDPNLKHYYANVTQIDEAVGEIVRVMKEEGIYDKTLIWYTSDNGPEGDNEFGFPVKKDNIGSARYRGNTGGLRGRKRHTHEGGIRVPGIISWPAGFKRNGLMPGGIAEEPIIGSDIFPTFLDIAGIDLPKHITLDGTSILPILENKKFCRTKPLYWRNNSNEFKVALREGDWKILANGDLTSFELYNLAIDPRETTDLSAHKPKLFERLKKALIEYDDEVLTEGPNWWINDRVVNAIPEKYHKKH
ncbi:sulfatase [Cellulophaga sp. L1A9]|uniref:sulfatase family protein n=1 Tax=Cellulophaga sp. L1A9 TaxID=2686362 RepID=UPI00131EA3C7|nr:sulfatase-like hydrolase/transferase [Cellulophaga sp. L1A9]